MRGKCDCRGYGRAGGGGAVESKMGSVMETGMENEMEHGGLAASPGWWGMVLLRHIA